jgi:hypothetical protein
MISEEYRPQGGSYDPWMEVVVSDRQSVISAIPAGAQEEIARVDFSKYFVIVASRGLAVPDSGLRVQRIRQTDDRVRVVARFTSPPTTTGPLSTLPFHIVKVKKDSLTFWGNIIFELLDESGRVRTVRSRTISPPWSLPAGTGIPFETIMISDWGLDPSEPKEPSVLVIATAQQGLIEGIPTIARTEIDKVDFSKYLVVVAFRGLAGPGMPIIIESIEQSGSTVYVVAWFEPPPRVSVPIQTYPFHIVKVDKGNLTSRGSITFKLLDEESGQERASATAAIP